MKKYIEEEKALARTEAIANAVRTLTKNRHLSTIARKNYVREVRDYIMSKGNNRDKELTSHLQEKEIKQWEAFYLSIIGKKKPSDLKVAYLSGPNPENDIEVLVQNGILAENIWAFESDNQIYDTAVISALESNFPLVKIYKGKIEDYLKILPFKFDIIYLDFCGTIISPKTISVLKDVFYYHKLNSPGIIITNFALPEKIDPNKETISNLINLSANYLYPKSFTENFSGLGGGVRESAESYGISPDKFIELALRKPENFYSQFITRILFDLPSIILPYQRFNKDQSLIDMFFHNFNTSSFDSDYKEDLMCFPNENSLIWGLNNFIIKNDTFERALSKLRKQLALDSNENALLNAVELMRYFITETDNEDLYSDKLKKISSKWRPFKKHVFCDVFLFHQLKDILIGQLTSPYFYNVQFTKRWTYKAKKTRMFMDMVTYDDCRYIFDWMPTIDMFEEGVSDINRQLSLRFAMDSISKQRRWYNDEFFNGTAVIDQDVKGFEAKELKKRIKIN